MSKISSILFGTLLCVLLTALTLVCLTADGLWERGTTDAPTQEPTLQIQQPEALPTEPQPQDPLTQVVFGETEDLWADCPDGIRIETLQKQNFIGHVMLIKDPSAVYLATSAKSFNINTLGGRLLTQMKSEGALAAINAGAFNDDGTSNSYIGSLPIGMVISDGEVLWDDGRSYDGFVGMTRDNRLYVADTIDRAAAEAMNIRDGCCFGPVLIKDGVPNTEKVHAYSVKDNINSRTAIGQRADGTVIFLCIDGRQVGSIGATFDQLLETMVELGAVNACALDGGASTIMAYKDTYGRYGQAGQIVTCSSYSLFQASPRRMPTFFMVRANEEE